MKKALVLVVVICMLFNTASVYSKVHASTDTESKITINEVSNGETVAVIEKDGILYSDVIVDGIMVYSSAYNNGRFEYAYSVGNITYYSMYMNGSLVMERQTEATVSTISESDLEIITAILEDETLSFSEIQYQIALRTDGQYSVELDNGAVCVIESPQVRTTTLNIGISDLTSKYPAQYQAYSSTYGFYCPYLATNKNIVIRDTRNNYVSTSSRQSFLEVGLTVAEIAATIWMSQGNVLDIFSAYLSLGQLVESLNTNRGITARSSRIRQGFIYDTTYVNGNVSVHSDYGNDYYAVTNQGYGYDWGEVPYTMKDNFPDSYVGQQSANTYNYNLNTYGYWQWGNI